MQTYRIVLNMDHARMSHILALKQIFRMHAGDLPVQMEFFSQNTRIGSLEIRAEWGIQSSKEIEALIKKIISVESITLVAK